MAAGQAGQDAEPKKTLAEIESERITRRAALRKFGFGAGMAALMALSVDDLARMAAVKLQQNAGDNQVANAVAKEFKNAGVAFADPPAEENPGEVTPHPVGEEPPGCGGTTVGNWCSADGKPTGCLRCVEGTYRNKCVATGGSGPGSEYQAARDICNDVTPPPLP